MNNNQLMYFNEHTDIYWHGTFMGAAVLLGGLLFWLFARLIKKGAAPTIKYIYFFGVPVAVALARLEYCWFRQDEFRGGLADVLNIEMGGFGFMGAMIGMSLVIIIVGACSKRYSIYELFDAAAPAAAVALCIGRLASYFSGEERGFELYMDYFQENMFTVYSASENKIFVSVYPYEAIAAGAAFVLSVVMFILVYGAKKFEPGTVAAQFLLLFTLTQILFESWRSDALFLVYLGFVRFNQAFSAIVLAIVLAVTCVKYSKKTGYKHSHIAIWVVLLLSIALAFVCEFFMTGGNHLQNYTGMIIGLVSVLVTAEIIMAKAFRADEEPALAQK